jgi:hypothetical protein
MRLVTHGTKPRQQPLSAWQASPDLKNSQTISPLVKLPSALSCLE